jgi:flagellar hook-length control protein FliK
MSPGNSAFAEFIMALATNPLLQALTAANAGKASASHSAKALEPLKNNASSFSDVYARQASAKSANVDSSPAKPPAAKSSATDDKPRASETSAAHDKTVADNGNGLPDKRVAASSDKDTANDKADQDDDADSSQDLTLTDAPVTDPLLDPLQPDLAVQPATVPVTPVTDAAAAPVDPALLASTLPQAVPAPLVDATTDDPGFDPHADPLEGLTAVQVALENKAQQSAQNSKAAADASKTGKGEAVNTDPAQALAGNLAALGDKPVDKDGTSSGDDKAFSGLIADGLKDVKGAAGDTRVDNFADRLAALSQAAQAGKTPSAPTAPLLNQPLAMNQSGWTEGVVNRVMYLSSMNLKQADIQLEPAELGRLDIRVNMATDQPTQVTFMSAHMGVRDALESQMSRLRDSFTQQGMGQVDVNVSDQSRGWQQQAQQQQSGDNARGNSGSGRTGGVDGIADGAPSDAAAVAASQPLTVVGSSAVDYYA